MRILVGIDAESRTFRNIVTSNTLSTNQDKDAQLAAELNSAVEANGSFASSSSDSIDAAIADTVDIATEKFPNRKRRIFASVDIPQSVEQVWQVITDYEHLADFVPNLTKSTLLPSAEGRIRLEQVGAQCFLRFKFCARVVLDMTERFPHQLGFTMSEGDFTQFDGSWTLQPTAQGMQLSYEVLVQPPRAMPIALIEHHLCRSITINLLAIRTHSMQVAQ